MALRWIILGTIAQLALAGVLFMLAVFTGAGVANERALGKPSMAILNLSMFALPGSCLVSAGIVGSLYRMDAGACSHGWYGLPLVATAVYLIYAIRVGTRS